MTDEKTGSSMHCPECGAMAIAHAMEIRGTGRRQFPQALDHQWCDTEGCKHNHDTGEPWGTGEEITGFRL